MLARRLALACSLAGACTPLQPVPEDISEPPPSELEPVPSDRDHSSRTLQLAAVSDEALAVRPLAGGSVAVYGRGVLALALGDAPLHSEAEWRRGWPDEWVMAVGGRWPDHAFLSAVASVTRTGMTYGVKRWRNRAWVDAPMLAYYSDFAVTQDGALLGLRGHVDDPTLGGDLASSQQASIDRLDDGPPPPWPELPKGLVADRLLTFGDGSVIVVGIASAFTPAIHRWTPGARKWTAMPPPPERSDPELGQAPAFVVGRDPAGLYAYRCLVAEQPALERMSQGTWQPFPQPGGGCITSLAEAPDGTLWLVNDRGLHRRRQGSAPWEPVPLAPVDAPGKPVAALPGAPEPPPPGPEPLVPQQVLALDRGELWVVATIQDPKQERTRWAVLTTRTVIAPLQLRPLSERTGS
ncbi:hypothetical protein OV203_19290 [Nannocystis sp. ILAH1]|uniref:hypothetical protein n=1 Tax=Nannocystis sp. ILAH1 TaxID=2996789 RepID=UPI0022712402|nr:hypothetical protein [Nannocystis sp. ILAH1]MCY0989292.1 hypothetical protein [Nannocystis sp. ILAH1]